MTISPVFSSLVPRGSNWPSAAMIATSGPAARPTVPGLRSAGGSGLQHIWWLASVMP